MDRHQLRLKQVSKNTIELIQPNPSTIQKMNTIPYHLKKPYVKIISSYAQIIIFVFEKGYIRR
jgi:hypothetical protein